MTRLSFRLGLSLFLAAFFATTFVTAGVRVKLEEVPKPALKAVQDRFPKATINYADRETNGNYEIAVKDGEQLLDVGVTPDGKLLNIKSEIAEEKVPKAVKDGLQKKHPGAKIVETEKVIVIDGKNEKVTYELKIKVGTKTSEVVLDEAGTLIGE